MPKACNLQKGNVVRNNEQPYQVKQIDVQTPTARGANTLSKVRFSGIDTGQKLDQTFKGNDFLAEMDMGRRPASFLFFGPNPLQRDDAIGTAGNNLQGSLPGRN